MQLTCSSSRVTFFKLFLNFMASVNGTDQNIYFERSFGAELAMTGVKMQASLKSPDATVQQLLARGGSSGDGTIMGVV